MTVDLYHHTTFRTTNFAQALITIDTVTQLEHLPEKLAGRPYLILGSGSNVLFVNDFQGIVILNRLKGHRILAENDQTVDIEVAAGEIWHNTVLELSTRGFHGLENLAFIPGTVGAAPVQNIGAYGVEVSQLIVTVKTFDIVNQRHLDFSNTDCQFAYRDSLFKSSLIRPPYLITAVVFRLNKHFLPQLSYRGLTDKGRPQTARALINTVVALRKSKLPDPEQLPNAGSFFKNPVVSLEKLTQLRQKHQKMPYFELDDGNSKIPAAWLIEAVGFKGVRRTNGCGVYPQHALILVNEDKASGKEIYALACDIMQAVKAYFGIELEPEVRLIGK